MLRTLLLTLLALPAFAGSISAVPTVVEVYTSKNCPSCPAGERYLEGWLEGKTTPLIVYAHVDYWDEHALKPDPLSLAEATQRQYDYSNVIGRRPGEVFTPQPIINGHILVKPSLRFNWPSAIEPELAKPLTPLAITQNGTSYTVTLPKGTKTDETTLWLMGLSADEKHPGVYHMRGLTEKELEGSNGSTTLAPETLPAGTHVLVLLQKIGPGAITASALITK